MRGPNLSEEIVAKTNQPERDPKPQPGQPETGRPAEGPEDEAAAEWGDRLGAGKDIARGGKQSGDVPGATEQEP